MCDRHGRFQAYAPSNATDFQAYCPRCIDEADSRRRSPYQQRQEDRRKAETLRRLSELAKIPRRFAGKTFNEYQAKAQTQRYALAVCRSYALNWPEGCEKGSSLVLTGSCGTGKTHLACAIANHLIAEHASAVVYATVPELSREVRDTYRRDSQRNEKGVIADLMAPELLIIDEVGAHKCSDHELQLIFDVVDGRYRQLRSTILISNLTTAELQDLLGERVMERFRECGTVVAFDWASHRGAQANA